MPRMVNDHSFWAGGKSKGSVFPEGNKVKHYTSAEGADSIDDRQTTEDIERVQRKAVSKMESHKMKPGERY